MKRALLLLAGAFVAHVNFAQDLKLAQKYANTITIDDLHKHESVLASDILEGRDTGKRGQKMAAAYISGQFQQDHLTGPVDGKYFQEFELDEKKIDEAFLVLNGKKLSNFTDILVWGKTTQSEKELEVVFLGKGTEKDFEGMEVEGKGVVVFAKSPRSGSAAKKAREMGAKAIFVAFEGSKEEFTKVKDRWSKYLSGSSLSIPSSEPKDKSIRFFISSEQAAEMFRTKANKLRAAAEKNEKDEKKNTLKKFKPGKVDYSLEFKTRKVSTENVLGYIEGSDKKDEVIVITAHYDHVGIHDGKVYNGADDDASGTSVVMEIAQAFAQAKADGHGPRRSMLFMTVTGEEKGLLGSDNYTQNPIFPLENTVCNLNIDMVGRVDDAHKDNENYIYLIGSDKLSTELHNISEKVNKETVNLNLDYTYNDENDPNRYYYRSDHYNFVKNNVPIIFYFNGTHADYHKDTDTIDKIKFPQMQKRAQLVFYTAWEVANREERIKVDKASADNGK
ncbi:M28 family peptidase [Xanthovirga aplysinae]|uniref:M28 family peptidase n=1 Tax=Xanthovirga aplysinae TaxID=2529853 RepID=UPI0012BCE0FF|nr:M28 family peptidase [Xanthovirga aplysinae]MTI30619.1 M28 family peptidase [Xanthovirga aplysinae]